MLNTSQSSPGLWSSSRGLRQPLGSCANTVFNLDEWLPSAHGPLMVATFAVCFQADVGINMEAHRRAAVTML